MAPEELEQQRLAFAIEQGVIAARVGIPASAIVAAASAPATGVAGALAWAAAMFGILLMRNRMLRRAGRLLAQPRGVETARRAMGASTLLLAIGLGVLPALAFPGLDYQLRLFVTVFFCCWYSAGMASLGVSPNMYTAYLVIVLGGMSVGWFRAGVPEAPYVTAGFVLFGMVLRTFARNIARRISESIAMRAENAELVRQLSQANEAKTRFIMAASHDLRQPLHAISYLGGVLARARTPDELRGATEALTSAVEGLNKLFSAILDLSRIESGAVRMHPVAFQVDTLVAQLDAEYRALCVAAGRRWECQVESATALTDPALLERILRNLLDNALKHGGQGMVRLAVWRREGEVVIAVSDTGPGIPAQERSRVFDEFYRVGDGRGQPGLGLGLSIVRRLADRLGCGIEIDDTDAVAHTGTTIVVHVPRGPEVLPQPKPPVADPPVPEQDVAGLRVLVIDDDAAVLHATQVLLSQWDCAVACCARADQLDAVLEQFGAPDVALVDYQFEGGTNGLDLLARVRLRYPGMGVVMVTAESDERVREQLAESGLPVLEKPVSPRELRLTLSLFKAAGE